MASNLRLRTTRCLPKWRDNSEKKNTLSTPSLLRNVFLQDIILRLISLVLTATLGWFRLNLSYFFSHLFIPFNLGTSLLLDAIQSRLISHHILQKRLVSADLLLGLLPVRDVQGVVGHQLEGDLQNPLLRVLDGLLVGDVNSDLTFQTVLLLLVASIQRVPAAHQSLYVGKHRGLAGPLGEFSSFSSQLIELSVFRRNLKTKIYKKF